MTINEKLMHRRMDLGLSMREVARRTGVSDPYICQFELHKEHQPSLKILKKLSKAYGVAFIKKVILEEFI